MRDLLPRSVRARWVEEELGYRQQWGASFEAPHMSSASADSQLVAETVSSALIASTDAFASPSSIWVFSAKKSGFSTPA